jgi:purine-binding chemotaxis protein CheW
LVVSTAIHCLLCQVGEVYLALPLEHVIEVTRPLVLQRLPEAPEWLLGVAIMRGEVTPILDTPRLITSDRATTDSSNLAAGNSARWVALRVEGRRVALTVDAVLATRVLSDELHADVPPLVASSTLLGALAALDRRLLIVLETARLLPAASLDEMGLHAGSR